MLSKLIYLAPVAFTTAGVTALVTLKIDDPKFKRILRAIAGVLFFGSLFAIVQQGAEILERLSQAESTIATERAKTAAAQAEARKAQEIAEKAELAARAAAEKAKLE